MVVMQCVGDGGVEEEEVFCSGCAGGDGEAVVVSAVKGAGYGVVDLSHVVRGPDRWVGVRDSAW